MTKPQSLFFATSSIDMGALSDKIASTPRSYRPLVAHYVWRTGLMIVKHPITRFTLWALWKLRGDMAVYQAFERLNTTHPELLDSIISDTATHVRFGTDREDKHSVGGWSQREVNLFMEAPWSTKW